MTRRICCASRIQISRTWFLALGKMAEQDECKLFALFIWIDDNPVKGNVFKLSNITKPFYYHNEHQKRDFGLYKTGQEVEARFDRNQKARAIIGGIEGM